MTPFGDRAVRFPIPKGGSRRRLFAELSALPGVSDVVLAEEIGCVVFVDARVDRAAVARALASRPGYGADATTSRDDEDAGTAHTIQVIYDGDDLDAVARAINRSKESVIALHSEPEYRVAMLGFLPGFAYLRDVPTELRLPRLAPRPRVPAGSVAIAAEYTGIYPFASPGGWHLLGRAPTFEPFGPRGATLAIGDVVRFVPSSDAPRPTRDVSMPARPTKPHLEITRAAGLALLVDGGRPGRMHEGVPAGGPLVRSLLTEANTRAGNPPLTCAVELSGTLEVVARGGSVVVADSTGRFILAEGERHAISTAGRTRVRYLSLAGGIEAPLVLGGRGTLLVAGIGAVLRKGDRLVPNSETGASLPSTSSLVSESEMSFSEHPITIMAGPDATTALLDELTAADFNVAAASDRTGTRLEGPPLHSLGNSQLATRRSTPMVIGSIELTPSGLIVLGPDHPTTGGYPVVAVVRDASLDRLFARPIGARVRFTVDHTTG